MSGRVTPCLLFAGNAEAAADFYGTVFGARTVDTMRAGAGTPIPAGSVIAVTFEIAGTAITAINGPDAAFSHAMSLMVVCETAAEVDRYWDGLMDGGTPVACGWITDKFGVTWQIVPKRLGEMMKDQDKARAGRVMAAMMGMVKLDIDALERAYHG